MPEQPQELTLLYVEDESVTRTEFARILQRRVSKVLVAENGSIGLGLFRRFSPDLVITDIRMPVMDGLHMAQLIREINPEIKIIATTAHNDTPYLMEAIEAGIDHYFLKPIDLSRLIGTIEKCSRDILARKAVQRHHQEREKLIAELQAALEEIKKLRGILPICMHCKDIRNDQGYWERVEAYIARHSEVDFSHSVCPSCLQKHYPEYCEDILGQKDKPQR